MSNKNLQTLALRATGVLFPLVLVSSLFVANRVLAEEPINPIPETVKINAAKAELGRALFP